MILFFCCSLVTWAYAGDLDLTLDQSNFTQTITKHDFLVVDFYAPCNDPPVTLAKVDDNDEKNKDLATEYDIKSFPTLKIIKNGGKTIQDYKGPRDAQGIDFNLDALEKFVEEASIPTVTVFNNDPKNHPFVINFFNTPNAKHKGKGISFLMGDVEATQGAFQFFGLKEDHVPVIVINNDKEKYVKPNLEPDHIESCLKEYKDGKIAPYVKSEPVPESNNQPVKVVVADNFDDIVFKSGKNGMLNISSLGLKTDATANDIVHEGFEIRGYPTLYFKSASGNLLKYSGKRTKEKIIDFIKKNKDNITPHDSRKEEL
ncbi:hypothetical protein L1987_08965 [Smallanthus sonchifolius]|uniref:Uncharacterized protein n=1 Tax=Smallanthus sonchifolius TaxID=185202 RepID=A0ACB9JN79_9ASTR|nr:hypothetical protein L1987_08965 [Smallanthus sonchifolius]